MVGFVLAVKVLPIIIFMASLMAVLYHLGIMQRIVALLARGLSRTMRISGAEALSTVGDIFLGMTEAPLLDPPLRRAHDRERAVRGHGARAWRPSRAACCWPTSPWASTPATW